ncbi:MAG TPA: M24 family metallopeptidase [Roseiflexaceae bacterium]|nr:M24 family metallopeptidase [Roseiflexaceae bacterium]
MSVVLRHAPPPTVEVPLARPQLPAAAYEDRMDRLYAAAACDWVVVYGDREHAANLAFCCGFDPRFEEALLLLGPAGRRTLVVGNEGLGYTPLAGAALEIALAQSLSLMGQARDTTPDLARVLAVAGIAAGARVGVVGWKYYEAAEIDDPTQPAFVPAFVLYALRRVIGSGGTLHDLTRLLMHPVSGLKSHNTAAQIAQSEWGAARSAAAVLRIVAGARPGMHEYETASLMEYAGEPLICHAMLASGSGPVIGLRSPTARVLQHGDGITTAIGYWGGLCCRAGLLRETPEPVFHEQYVVPYFRTLAAWWSQLRIGMSGGDIDALVRTTLADAPFKPALNPGHLIALDEWTHTPIRPGSNENLASGMILQCDIIPAPMPDGWVLNCEDSVALADASLRADIAAGYPQLWQRIEARRNWMHAALGISLADEVLPLSVAPAGLAPYWLMPDLRCAIET